MANNDGKSHDMRSLQNEAYADQVILWTMNLQQHIFEQCLSEVTDLLYGTA